MLLLGKCYKEKSRLFTLLNPKYRDMLQSLPYRENLVTVVVDEAHCVKLWGDQFHKAFSQIGGLCSLLPSGVRVMALTATVAMETYHTVVQRLLIHGESSIGCSCS